MSPKEKARELVDKFSNEILLTIDGGKADALIVVDEILEVIEDPTGKHKEYWEEVKQEIEKI